MSEVVSDGYMTVILLGAALCALALARQVFARRNSHALAEHPLTHPAPAEPQPSKPNLEATASAPALTTQTKQKLDLGLHH
jgi:hypothetical protein